MSRYEPSSAEHAAPAPGLTPGPESELTPTPGSASTPAPEQARSLHEALAVALSNIVSDSPNFAFVKDINLNYVFGSLPVVDAFGLSGLEELIGKTDGDLASPEFAERYNETDHRVIETGKPLLNISDILPDKDGSPRYSRMSKYPLRDSSGNIIGIYGIGHDVTKQLKQDFELDTLLHTIPSGIMKYSADEKGEFAYLNRNFVENLGYTETQFREKFNNCFHDMVYIEDRAYAESEIIKQESDGDIGRFDYRIEAADGTLHWFHDEGVKIVDQLGQPWYYVTLMDVTAQYEAERRERETRNQLLLSTQLVDDASSSVYVCDAETYELFYINARCARMCAKPLDEAKGRPCYEYLKGQDKPCDPCYMDFCTDTDYTERLYSSPATGKHYMTRGKFINWDGRRALVEYMNDVTAQIEAQLRLESSHRAIEMAGRNAGISFWHFDLDTKTLFAGETQLTTEMGYAEERTNIPEGMIEAGEVYPDDIAEFLKMYDALFADADEAECTIRLLNHRTGEYLWHHIAYTRLHDPLYCTRRAVGFSENVELQQEIELRYRHELQLRQAIMKNAVIYYELNLSTRTIEEYRTELSNDLQIDAGSVVSDEMDERILSAVAPDYRQAVRDTIFTEPLLAAYERGETDLELVYRRFLPDLGLRWVRATANIMKRFYTNEVIAFLYFHDIDDEQKARLAMSSAMDEEIDSIIIFNVESDMTRFIKAPSDIVGADTLARIDRPTRVATLLDSGVLQDDRAGLHDFMQMDKLVKLLHDSPSTSYSFRFQHDGRLLRKRFLAYYLDDTHEDIVLSRRDVTEEWNAEKRLSDARRNEELMRMVAEHSARIIYRYDLVTHEAVSMEPKVSDAKCLPNYVSNMPESLISNGTILSEDANYVRELFRTARTLDAYKPIRFRVCDSKGKILWLDVKFSFVTVTDGEAPLFAIISCLDVTELHEREVAYARYCQTIDESMADDTLYFETDLTADIIEKQGGDLLPVGFDATGCSHVKVIEDLLDTVFTESNRAQARHMLSREHLLMLYGDGTREIAEDWEVRFSDGTLHWVRCSIQLVTDPYTGHIKAFAMSKDITAEKLDTLDIRNRAETDPLTGIWNRATFAAKMLQLSEEATPDAQCTLLMMDIDGFKLLNDTLGHTAGDQALVEVATILRSVLRQGDLLGRLGGDEFVVALKDMKSDSDIKAKVEQIGTLLRKTHASNVQTTVSIGIAVCPRDGRDFDTLYTKADAALYTVKRAGRDNFAFFKPSMLEEGSCAGEGSSIGKDSHSEGDDPTEKATAQSAEMDSDSL